MATKKRTRRRDPEAHVPSGRPNTRTLAQFRREVVALLRAGHRIPSEEGIRLVSRHNEFVKASWQIRRAPCWVSDNLARKRKESRVGRDYQNPIPGEVYQSRAGSQWEVTSVNSARRRVKVKRTGFRDLGELEWNPIVLKDMQQIQSDIAARLRYLREAEPVKPLDADTQEKANWFRRTFGTAGDPDRRYYVYVIESVRDGRRVLYVGQSAHKPAERLLQHKKGARYCKGCTKRSYAKGTKMRLVPEFYKKIPVIRTRQAAEKVERILARKLRSLGFTVEGGH